MSTNGKEITVRCDFADKVSRMLTWLSNLYGEFWSCFNFRENDDDKFVIIVKSEPTYGWYADETNKFLAMSDEAVCDHIKETVFDLMNSYAKIFQSSYSKMVLYTLRDCINDWKVIPPPLPKMTHEELVKLVGHDFEYVKYN